MLQHHHQQQVNFMTYTQCGEASYSYWSGFRHKLLPVAVSNGQAAEDYMEMTIIYTYIYE